MTKGALPEAAHSLAVSEPATEPATDCLEETREEEPLENDPQELLANWLQPWTPLSRTILLASCREKMPGSVYLIGIEEIVSLVTLRDSLYILQADTHEGRLPLYVGKADDLFERWNVHLDLLVNGNAYYQYWERTLLADGKERYKQLCRLEPLLEELERYERWRKLLLDEEGLSRYQLWLTLLPLPGPQTLESTERQLIKWCSETWPQWMLN